MGARSAQPGQTNGTVTTTRPPRHRTRRAACRRAQGRRHSGVVDAAPRLVSPVRPDRTLRWHARPPRSLKTRTPRRLPVTRARARGGALPRRGSTLGAQPTGSAYNALAVGAVREATRTKTDVASFSSGASLMFPGQDDSPVIKPDVVAPGVRVYSCIPPEKPQGEGFEYSYMDGTSMASPHVAGVAA